MMKSFSDEKGFTIQEVLIVIVVGSLLVGFGLSMIGFARKAFSRFEYSTNQKDAVHRIVHTVARDIRRSRMVISKTPSSVVMQRVNGDTVRYQWDSLEVTRNAALMSLGGKAKLSLQIAEHDWGLWTVEVALGHHGSSYEEKEIVSLARGARLKFNESKAQRDG